jgi:hypothetical protein
MLIMDLGMRCPLIIVTVVTVVTVVTLPSNKTKTAAELDRFP